MTRKQLLAAICPSSRMHDCENYHCVDCNLELIKWLDEYDKQIRADAIDEFADKLNAKCSGMIKDKWNSNVAPISWAEAYADFKDDIEEIAEQLKEGRNNENYNKEES